MLARVAADFYWLGRYVERIEQTARLLEYQLTRLVDRPADELAVGWGAIYRALGQAPPGATSGVEEAEDFLIPDAYTLAGNLVEESANPDSILSCWRLGREKRPARAGAASAFDMDGLEPGLSLDARSEFRQGVGAGAGAGRARGHRPHAAVRRRGALDDAARRRLAFSRTRPLHRAGAAPGRAPGGLGRVRARKTGRRRAFLGGFAARMPCI